MKRSLRTRQRLGKYRIERLLAHGGFAEVYRAFDTIEGLRVALKVPYSHLVDKEMVETFRKEVRITAKLDHPNVLPIKNAVFIDNRFVVASPLGERTLADRLKSRIGVRAALDLAEQMIAGLAVAHRHKVLHCDVKPENFILFPGNRIRLGDFGIAKVAVRTLSASGSGTLGYMAPEQAMGKPSFRSDVFSLGLTLYRLFSGKLPQWPFSHPLPGHRTLRERLHPDMVSFLERAIEISPRKRYENADRMLKAFLRIKPRALMRQARKARKRNGKKRRPDWAEVRWKQFLRDHGKSLEVRSECPSCHGPVAETMHACCWCGVPIEKQRGKTRFPASCPRCRRGLKLDWKYCPWCYGPSVSSGDSRSYSDVRYSARCNNPSCSRKQLMPFMRYCPWCRRKVKKKWLVPGSRKTCSACGWGVLASYWDYCPWCASPL